MPNFNRSRTFYLALAAITGVWLFAHRQAITSSYVINDDVRQQVYWMQQFQDDRLYPDDLLTEYARAYVPWGVTLIYRAAAPLINPVSFSKVVAAALFLFTGAVLFLFVRREAGETAALMTMCCYCYLGQFIGNTSGGLSRGFVFPLMALHLYFLSGDRMTAAAVVAGLQSLFNPYLFLLCACTHMLYFGYARRNLLLFAGDRRGIDGIGRRRLLSLLPIFFGGLFLVVRHLACSPEQFGPLVTRQEMIGRVEYTAAGRFPIVPVPSLLFELVRPFCTDLPASGAGIAAGLLGLVMMAAILLRGLPGWRRWSGFAALRPFLFLLAASFCLHLLARLVLMKLFVPSRYVEYSLPFFYCTASGILLAAAVKAAGLKRLAPLLVAVLMVLGAVRLDGIRLFDYREHAALHRYLEKTPVTSLVAGHPDLMDNVQTFARRKVFVSYELSHTWYKRYWATVRRRTDDLFRAYYAADHETVQHFLERHGVDYLVVREEDFLPEKIASGTAYFQPFGHRIRADVLSRKRFAVMDPLRFPPVFQQDGVRVIVPAAAEAGPSSKDVATSSRRRAATRRPSSPSRTPFPLQPVR
jgi:hypothetical protein